jgi:prolyl-tRNA synthetase
VPLIEDGVSGANKEDYHLRHIVYGRDYKADLIGDIRYALRADKCPRCEEGKFEVSRGIEVGHIFKLGTKYSEKMKCTFLDENNQERPMIMGCYGIGIGRTMQAAIEQNHDRDGIVWPIPLAPFLAAIVPVNVSEEEQKRAAERIYQDCLGQGLEVLLDDREERVGVKLKDMDLIGIPYKVIVGRALKEGKVEVKSRKTGEAELLEVEKVGERVRRLKE